MSRASPASAMDTSVNPEVAAILRALAPEEIDMLRDAFIFMDKDSDGFVSRTEMLKIVSRSVDPERYLPLKQYLTPLFDVADKDGDGQLSLIEFLVSFVSGPGVLPAEVINSCVADVRVRLTDEEVSAIQDNFRFIDRNRDGFIDREELDAALRANLLAKFPDLSDSNFKEIVAVIMTSADANHDGKLSLSEFIRSFQEDQGVLPAAFAEASAFHLSAARELTSEELEILQEAFGVLDKDGDGIVEFSTLYESLWETLSTGAAQPSQIRDLCELIMVTADRHHANRLTVADFIRSFIRRMLILQISVHTAQEKIRNACAELQQRLISGDLDTPAAPVSDERRSSTVSAMGVPTHGLYVNGTDPIGLPIKGVYLNDCGIPVDVHGCPVFNLYVHGADARGVPIKGMYVDAAGLPVDIMGQPVGGLYVGGVNTSGATIRGVYLDAEGRPIDDHGEVVEGMQEEGVDGNGVPIKGVRANARGIPITPAGLPLVGLLVNGTTPNRMPIKGVYVNANGEATDRQGGVLAGMTVEGVDANGMPIKGVFVAPNGLPAVSTLPKRHYIDGVDGNGYPIKGLYVDKSGQAINGAPLDGLFVDGVDTHGFPLKGTHVDSKGEPLRVLLIDGKDSSGKSIKGLPVNVCGVPVDADGFPVNVMQVDGTTADGQTLKGVHVDSNGVPVDADGHPVRGYWVEGRCSHGSVMRGLYLNEEGLPVDTHGAVVKGMTVDGVDQNDVPIKGVLLRYIRPSPLLCTLVEGTTADAKEPMRGVVLQAGDAQARDCAGAVIERFVVAGVDKSGAPIMGFRVNEVGVPVNEDGTYFKGLFVDGHDEDGVAIKGVYLDGNSAPIDEHGNIIKGMFAEGVDHFGVPIKGVYVDADGTPILDTFVEGVDEHGLPMKGVYVGTKGEPVDANDVPVEGLYASGVDFNGLPIKGTHVDAAGVPLDRSGASMRGMYVDGVDPFGLPMKGVYTQGGATSVAVAAGFRVKGVDADGQEILGVHVDDDGIPVHGVDDRGDCVKGALFPGVDENARPMRGVYVNERGAALHATPASSCMTVSGVDANDVKLIGLHLNESGELLQLNGEPLLQIPANGMDSHLYAIKGVYTDPVGVPITGSSIGMRVNGVDFNGLSLKGMYVGPSGFPTRGLFVDAACGDGVSVTGFLVRGEDAHGVELCGVYLNESGEPVDGTGKLVSGMYADGTDIDGVPIRGMYTDSHGLPMDEHGAVLRGNVQFPSGAPVRGRCAPGDCTVDRDKMIALLKQLFRDCFDWDDPTLTSVMTAAVTGAGSDQRLSLHNFISNFANGGISQDLVHCCASVGSAPPPESIDGATDEELIIISGALRVLNDRMEVEGSVAMADLQDAISSAFIEEGPEKVEYMLQYVLDHFIRVEDGDRVRWNENVQIEEEELPTDEATTSALCPDAEAMALAELRDLYPSAARAAPTTSGTVQAVQATRDESEPSAVVKSESTAAPEPEAEPQAAETSTNPSPTHEQTSGALVEVQQPKTTTTVAMNRYYAAAKTTQRVPRKPLADFVEESYDYTFEEDLRRLFMKFDKDNLGYLDRQDFKQSYIDLEQYGLERSRPEIDRLFKQYAHGSNRIYFDEFCVLMLKRVRM